ncbi:endonuclease domain-containing protein [Corynebacterium flavescens]|nr:DUF559 domain-containing protein [Corynebacterium flavescens]MDN6098688.1 endonuclease domain-containing protein [Corynebacterium flavescens]GEB96681.1 hypothetical protein CFL01nite_01760 [Corynebacterium flavescens]
MLRESGVGKRALAKKVAEGTLHRIHRGIFVEGKVDAAAVARALVVGLVRIAFTGKTASEIFLGKRLTFPLEAEGPRTIAGPSFKVTRSRLRAVSRHGAWPVIEPLWAARKVPRGCDSMLEQHYRGKEGPQRLERDKRRMRRVPAGVQAAIRRCAIGADSPPEVSVSRRLKRTGLKVAHNQSIAGYRFDLRIGRVLVEIDGFTHHSDHRSFVKDRLKANAATLAGFTVLRFTADCVRYHFDEVIAQIICAVEQKRRLNPRLPFSALSPAWHWHACL